MNFSFQFFDSEQISGNENMLSDNVAPSTSDPKQPWWIKAARDSQNFQNFETQLRFIGKEEFLAIQKASITAGIIPRQEKTSIHLHDSMQVEIVRPEKEIKVEDAVTDLIPGQYEGGYKLWECSIDLAEYLVLHKNELLENVIPRGIISRPLRVLELGCGIGLPGLAAQRILPENTQLWLSDFNDSVLLETTWPSLLSCPLEEGYQQGKISSLYRQTVAGDWLAFSSWLKAHNEPPFDIILSAETLYSPLHCEKIAYFITQHLTPHSGLAIFSNKRFYFGVGGGSTYFTDIMNELNHHNLKSRSTDGIWKVETVQSITDGQSNIRDIQVVRFQS